MSKWFVKHRCSNDARHRIFCFPYAGGSASAFNDWPSYFDDHVDIFAVQAPGREERFNERPIEHISRKVEILVEEIRPFIDLPYIFIGHSNGALTAFELARELQKINNFNLEHIFLSAKRAPHLPSIRRPVYELPYDEFIEELKTFSTIPSEIINDPNTMEVFMPMLRADFGLGEMYDFDPRQKLRACATLFWGNEDEDVPKKDVMAWKEHIVGKVSGVEFKGSHFFIHDEKEKFIKEIKTISEGIVQRC